MTVSRTQARRGIIREVGEIISSCISAVYVNIFGTFEQCSDNTNDGDSKFPTFLNSFLNKLKNNEKDAKILRHKRAVRESGKQGCKHVVSLI